MTIGAIELGGFTEDLTTILTKAPQYAGDIAKIVTQAGRYIPTLVRVVEDPAFPTIIDRVQQLRSLEVKKVATATPNAPAPKGIGLQAAVKPLDAFIWSKEHPYGTYAAIGGGVLLLLGIGFVIGRASAR